MKTLYKKFLYVASGTFLCLFLALPASAQRGGGGGGGGGSRSSGGGGGGGSVSSSPSVSSSSSGRSSSMSPSYSSPQRTSVAPPSRASSGQQGFSNRQSTGTAVRGNSGYASRQGSVGYDPRQGASSVGGNYSRGGNYGYAQRSGIAARGSSSYGGVGYRTSPSIGYGSSRGYWGNHNYNYYNHGYYDSYYSPRLGFACSYLPYGYYPFYYGDFQYYYSDGLYYQYDNNQYTVVEPPVGAEVKNLPEKAQSIVINGQQYYELNGVYYQAVTKDDGTIVYQIAGKDGELNTNLNVGDDQQDQGPQMGDVVNQLPQDCRKIKVNGEKLYVSPDGVYYQVQVDGNGNKTYKVVGIPTDEPEQN